MNEFSDRFGSGFGSGFAENRSVIFESDSALEFCEFDDVVALMYSVRVLLAGVCCSEVCLIINVIL